MSLCRNLDRGVPVKALKVRSHVNKLAGGARPIHVTEINTGWSMGRYPTPGDQARLAEEFTFVAQGLDGIVSSLFWWPAVDYFGYEQGIYTGSLGDKPVTESLEAYD